MKLETKIKDLRVAIAVDEAEEVYAERKHRLEAALKSSDEAACIGCVREMLLARAAVEKADGALRKLPKARRNDARSLPANATAYAFGVARQGGGYSGDTCYEVRFSDAAHARTSTGRGARYSGSCKYNKTDATHYVELDPAGVPLLMETGGLRHASAAEGLALIALYPGNSAVWVRTKGKAIVSERGWVAFEDGVIYHSTESAEHAAKSLAKKLKVIREERALRDPKVQRRIKLIARLCGDTKATIKDAKALGYCDPGIKAFQDRFGIKDSASLPDLIKTGDPSAVRLALHLAKKIHFKSK